MCNCTVIESFGDVIINAERWSSVNGDLNSLTVAQQRLFCHLLAWLHEIDFISPVSEALIASGLEITSLQPDLWPCWRFPLEDGRVL